MRHFVLAEKIFTNYLLIAENREAIREMNGLEKLVDYLGNQDFKEMHANSLNVLGNCLEDTQCLDVNCFKIFK
jgi:hypothetical protein